MKIREFWACTCLAVLWVSACGGDDSGGDGNGGDTTSTVPSALEMSESCMATCQKQKTCLGSTAGAALDCATLCGADKFPERTDCDYAQMKSKLDQCTAGGCNAIVVCEAEALVICPPPPGAGGPATGTCDDCEKVKACCASTLVPTGTDPATCDNFSRTTCEASPAKAALAAGCTAAVAMCPR